MPVHSAGCHLLGFQLQSALFVVCSAVKRSNSHLFYNPQKEYVLYSQAFPVRMYINVRLLFAHIMSVLLSSNTLEEHHGLKFCVM